MDKQPEMKKKINRGTLKHESRMWADREKPLKQSVLKKVVRGKEDERQTNTGRVWLLKRMRRWIKRRKSTLLKRQKSKWKIMKIKQ